MIPGIAVKLSKLSDWPDIGRQVILMHEYIYIYSCDMNVKYSCDMLTIFITIEIHIGQLNWAAQQIVSFNFQEMVYEATKHGTSVVGSGVAFKPVVLDEPKQKKAIKYPRNVFNSCLLHLIDHGEFPKIIRITGKGSVCFLALVIWLGWLSTLIFDKLGFGLSNLKSSNSYINNIAEMRYKIHNHIVEYSLWNKGWPSRDAHKLRSRYNSNRDRALPGRRKSGSFKRNLHWSVTERIVFSVN